MSAKARTIFITGTDTGAGKTVLTALLLRHLRAQGFKTAAMKPFCSGSREDVDLLQALQEGERSRKEINPFFYRRPLAPLAADPKRLGNRPLDTVLQAVFAFQKDQEITLVEGCGGLCVPLAPGLLVLDVIAALGCDVIVSAINKLGMLNHTLLTVRALQDRGLKGITVVLMNRKPQDASSRTNFASLKTLLGGIPLFELADMGLQASDVESVIEYAKKMEKVLARISRMNTLSSAFGRRPKRSR